jgi:hypothetical protein
MQRDEIIEMAKEAGFWQDLSVYEGLGDHFEAFAKLVEEKTRKELREEIVYTWVPPHFVDLAVKEERDACAKLCDAAHPNTLPAMLGMQIRARGDA